MKKINVENPFFDFMGRVADVVIANLLFVAASLPVITIGASTAALYETIAEMRQDTFVSSARSFYRAFRSAFRKSLSLWLMQLLSGIVLIFDLMYVVKAPDTAFWHTTSVLLGGLFLLWMMLACYLFPAGLYREKTWKIAVKRSIYLAIRNLPCTLGMMLIHAVPGICLLLGDYYVGVVTPLYLAAGFGVSAWINTALLDKCKEIKKISVEE